MAEVIEILSSDNEQEDVWYDAHNGSGDRERVADNKDNLGIDLDQIVSKILEVVPDVALEHLEALVGQYLEKGDPKLCVESIMHTLFEAPSYPKSQPAKSHKRKREAFDTGEGQSTKVVRLAFVDYGSKDRAFKGTAGYLPLAVNQLCTDFPFIPVSYIRTIIRKNNNLYAPTHLQLLADQASAKPPFKAKSTRTKVAGKCIAVDNEYLAEREWLDKHLRQQVTDAQPDEEEGDIECGCCFGSYSFVWAKMIQCAEGHLFCRMCVTSHAEILLGGHNCVILCMDQSDCKEPFPEGELDRVLPPKLLDLYYRVRQRKEITAAGLEGLQECPFCDFKYVIENPDEKLFRCQNEECQAITCRTCKKSDHLPKSCKELEDDTRLNGRHAVEEALSKALMRSCPKCKQQSIIKEFGCNKMTCPECHTLFCYICQQVVTGYDHFEQANRPNSKKCPLYDGTARINKQIEDAAKRAAQEFRADNPDVEDKDLAVDIPKVPGPNQQGVGVAPQAPAGNHHHHYHHHHIYPFNFGLGQAAPALPQPQFGLGGVLNRPMHYAPAPVNGVYYDEVLDRMQQVQQPQQLPYGLPRRAIPPNQVPAPARPIPAPRRRPHRR